MTPLRRTRRLPRTFLALLATLALTLAACGGTEDGSTSADGTEAPDGEAADDEGTEAAGDPVRGGTFTYGAFGEIDGLDPVRNGGGASTGGIPGLAVYDSLMRVGDDGQAEPYLAESMETEDGQTWTMTLQEGIRFHDDTPMDAEAVRFNLARHLDPENNSPHIAQVSAIQDMEVVDELTIEFTLSAPQASFPMIFTQVPGMIASPTAVEEHGEDYNLNPVGAGPFEFEEWVVDDHLTLVANDDYWQEDLPYLDEFVYRPMPDRQTRYAAIQSGDIDATYTIGMFPELVEAQESPDLETITFVGNGGNALLLNTQSPPLDDVRVRRAVAHLLDYEAIDEVRYQGNAPEGRGVFTEDSPWYADVEYPDHDPEQARELLDEYLAETGQEQISLEIGSLPDRRQLSELTRGMLDVEGIDVSVEQIDVAEFVPKVFGGDFQIAGWAMTHFIEPDLALFPAFHSESRRNASGIANDELDAALERGRTSMEHEDRVEAYGEVSRLLAEQLPYVFTARSVQSMIHQPEVRGLDHYSDMQFLSDEIWLDE